MGKCRRSYLKKVRNGEAFLSSKSSSKNRIFLNNLKKTELKKELEAKNKSLTKLEDDNFSKTNGYNDMVQPIRERNGDAVNQLSHSELRPKIFQHNGIAAKDISPIIKIKKLKVSKSYNISDLGPKLNPSFMQDVDSKHSHQCSKVAVTQAHISPITPSSSNIDITPVQQINNFDTDRIKLNFVGFSSDAEKFPVDNSSNYIQFLEYIFEQSKIINPLELNCMSLKKYIQCFEANQINTNSKYFEYKTNGTFDDADFVPQSLIIKWQTEGPLKFIPYLDVAQRFYHCQFSASKLNENIDTLITAEHSPEKKPEVRCCNSSFEVHKTILFPSYRIDESWSENTISEFNAYIEGNWRKLFFTDYYYGTFASIESHKFHPGNESAIRGSLTSVKNKVCNEANPVNVSSMGDEVETLRGFCHNRLSLLYPLVSNLEDPERLQSLATSLEKLYYEVQIYDEQEKENLHNQGSDCYFDNSNILSKRSDQLIYYTDQYLAREHQ